jgi:uncharacterized protein YndB with AHSA1/START domain
MHRIHVKVTINAKPAKVFALLSDHERFLRGPGIDCRLVTEGRGDRNGVGAVREVTAAGSVFTEEVTKFDPPRYYEYVVRTTTGPLARLAPLKHDRGWIELSHAGEETRVDWQTCFGSPLPVVGWMVERLAGVGLRRVFAQLLTLAKAELERGAPV